MNIVESFTVMCLVSYHDVNDMQHFINKNTPGGLCQSVITDFATTWIGVLFSWLLTAIDEFIMYSI